MKYIIILTLGLFCSASALFVPEIRQTNNNNGGISNVMENLAEHTASVTNGLLAQLLANTERTSRALVDNIEVVVASALNELSLPIENFQSEISSSECEPLLTLELIKQQLDSDLSKCTQSLHNILNTLKQNTEEFKVAVQRKSQEIIALPSKCANIENAASFANRMTCYVDNMAQFNKEIAVVLNNGSESVARARQSGAQAVQESRACVKNVIATTADNLNNMLDNCKLTQQQLIPN